MATSGPFTSRKAVVRFEDAAGTGLTVGPGPGDLNVGETNRENAEHIRVLDRSTFDAIIEGDDLEQECTITIRLQAQSLTHATNDRILDFLMRRNKFSALQTVSANPDIWAWKCIWSATAAGASGSRTFPHCTGGWSMVEGKEGTTISITFRNNGAPVDT